MTNYYSEAINKGEQMGVDSMMFFVASMLDFAGYAKNAPTEDSREKVRQAMLEQGAQFVEKGQITNDKLEMLVDGFINLALN